jgi:hypothetical protein
VFFDLHLSILKAFEFDNKHGATFYRSNDNWQRGREISLEVYRQAVQGRAAPDERHHHRLRNKRPEPKVYLRIRFSKRLVVFGG